MKLAPLFTRIASLPLALLLVSAAPTDRVIPHPEVESEALIVPHDSPVKFRRWGKYGYAQFDGRFVLTGAFTYGCEVDCDGPVKEADLAFNVVPDPVLAARLPHWKVDTTDMMVRVGREKRLARAVITPQQRAALLSGKLTNIRGRISIIVDDFQTGIECDSAGYSARFVAIAKAPKIDHVELNGDYGCV